MPIISQREALPTHEEAQSRGASREVKDRIMANMSLNQGAAPQRMAQSHDPVQVDDSQSQEPELKTETMPEEESPAPAPQRDEAIAQRMAAIARRDREVTRKQLQFAAEKKAWEEARAQAQTPAFDPSQFISKSDLDSDLLGTLGKFGYNYDKIVETALSPQNAPLDREIRQLKAQIEELKGGQTKVQEEFQSRQKLEYDQAVHQIRRDAANIVAQNPDYETIRESGSVEAVVKLIEKTFEDTGDMLSIDEAAAQVEEYLIEESLKVANYKKIKARLSQSPLETQVAAPTHGALKQLTVEKSQKPNTHIQLRTLTNATRASSSSPARSDAERRARAIAVAKGEKI